MGVQDSLGYPQSELDGVPSPLHQEGWATPCQEGWGTPHQGTSHPGCELIQTENITFPMLRMRTVIMGLEVWTKWLSSVQRDIVRFFIYYSSL